MDGSDFQKNKPQRSKIGIKNEKNEVKTFYFGDHIWTWSVISKKKKVFIFFSNQRAARGFNSFSKSGPSCEKLAHPWSKSIYKYYGYVSNDHYKNRWWKRKKDFRSLFGEISALATHTLHMVSIDEKIN